MFVLTGLFLAKCFGFLNNGIITSFSDLNSQLDTTITNFY